MKAKLRYLLVNNGNGKYSVFQKEKVGFKLVLSDKTEIEAKDFAAKR